MFDAHINAQPHMHMHEHRHRQAHAVTQEFPHTYKTCSIDNDSIHLLLRHIHAARNLKKTII